jgi:hypothetical protein
MIHRLQRATDWTWEQIDASPAQFRKLIPPANEMDKVIKLAVHAGKRMGEQLAKAANVVKELDRSQVEEWRRRFGVPKNRVNVMLMMAWSTLKYHRRLERRNPKIRTLGVASPRVTAKTMIAHYGFRAEKMARILRKGNRKNRKHWDEVLMAMRVIRMKVQLAPTVNLARRGAGQFCSYMAKQQRSLRMAVPVKQTTTVPAIAIAPRQLKGTRRLIRRKVVHSPTLCLAMDEIFHARCNRAVPIGHSVFCAVCQPRKERS